MSDFDKIKRNINDVKRGIRNLRALGLKIEIDNGVENRFGCLVDSVYVVDYTTGAANKKMVTMQERLFESISIRQ